jgi:hypothetical protein
MVTTTQYLDRVRQRLAANGFECQQDVIFQDLHLTVLAKRKKSEPWQAFMPEEIQYLVTDFSDLTIDGLKEFFELGMQYIAAHKGYGFSLFVPVAVADRVDAAVVRHLTSEPPNTYTLAGGAQVNAFPAAYDLSAGTLWYTQKMRMYNALNWPRWKKLTASIFG